ncbi:hypothetical protein DAPPUDRAFT_233583 [Daphnia pulex]|uniref:Uncharacterized protein n=1 Tax=Daphnia pulex TaxID=6669 RepID=E9FV69_DAPPU|nr:hypothetical protein DAPPUDRAFT_233583 [Daphnia pulex]|eukprot:EFX88505.1 hypothetical protein DAPPUDRAFT_233583 [Daphnia pulex]
MKIQKNETFCFDSLHENLVLFEAFAWTDFPLNPFYPQCLSAYGSKGDGPLVINCWRTTIGAPGMTLFTFLISQIAKAKYAVAPSPVHALSSRTRHDAPTLTSMLEDIILNV